MTKHYTEFQGFVIAACLLFVGKGCCGCCPDGWTIYRGKCYYFTHKHDMTFVEAEHFCQEHGAKVVHVNDEQENTFLKAHLERLAVAGYWMGLTDEMVENDFRWVDTNTNPEFVDWYPGEPSNGKHGEDCVIFWSAHDYSWNDTPCSSTHQTICESEMVEEELIG